MLEEGDPAPDFTLTADDSSAVTLSSLRGRPVVLHFHPEDDSRCSICSKADERGF